MNTKQLSFNAFPPLDYACNEAINTLCSNLTFAGNNVKKIMLTSCRASEGKSFISMNIMRSMADMGKNVVLVDADLRRSSLDSKYGIVCHSENIGLVHYLAGKANVEDIIYETNIEGAYMVRVGRDAMNSLALLSTPLFPQLLDQLAAAFDYVIVDAPPVGVIIDAAMIATACDGTLVVVSNNLVSRRELKDVKQQIEKTGCPILGAVLNRVEGRGHTYGRYGGGYYKKNYYKNQYAYYHKDTTQNVETNRGKKA